MSHPFSTPYAGASDPFGAPMLLSPLWGPARLLGLTAACAGLVLTLGAPLRPLIADAPALAAAAAALVIASALRAAWAILRLRREALAVAAAHEALDAAALGADAANDQAGERARRRRAARLSRKAIVFAPPRLAPRISELKARAGAGVAAARRRSRESARASRRLWTGLIAAPLLIGGFVMALSLHSALLAVGQVGSATVEQAIAASDRLSILEPAPPGAGAFDSDALGALSSSASATSLAEGVASLTLGALAAALIAAFAVFEAGARRALGRAIDGLGRRDDALAARARDGGARQQTAVVLRRLAETQNALLLSQKALVDRIAALGPSEPMAAPAASAVGQAEEERRSGSERRSQDLDFVGRDRRSDPERRAAGSASEDGADSRWMIEMTAGQAPAAADAQAQGDGAAVGLAAARRK